MSRTKQTFSSLPRHHQTLMLENAQGKRKHSHAASPIAVMHTHIHSHYMPSLIMEPAHCCSLYLITLQNHFAPSARLPSIGPGRRWQRYRRKAWGFRRCEQRRERRQRQGCWWKRRHCQLASRWSYRRSRSQAKKCAKWWRQTRWRCWRPCSSCYRTAGHGRRCS